VRHGEMACSTSDLGQQRTCRAEIAMSALPLKADIRRHHRDVSFGPISDQVRRSKRPGQSITSSASASNLSGICRPRDLAVLRLIVRSNLVGCRIGRSAGFSPFKIRAT
jgi:hypothetical protein